MNARSLFFLSACAVVTLMAGLVYAAVQQDYRQNANDPQIQLSEDVADALSQGQDISPLKNATLVDMAKSLAPFYIIVDDKFQIQAASGELNNNTPLPPSGVFTAAKTKENRLTWQPASGVRVAAVITHYQSSSTSGYVLVGRSLREVENREARLELEVAVAWIASIFVIAFAFLFKPRRSLERE